MYGSGCYWVYKVKNNEDVMGYTGTTPEVTSARDNSRFINHAQHLTTNTGLLNSAATIGGSLVIFFGCGFHGSNCQRNWHGIFQKRWLIYNYFL